MKVVLSLEDGDGLRCVDILEISDGIFAFKEYRKDIEDPSRWFLVNDYSKMTVSTRDQAVAAASKTVPWLKMGPDGSAKS